MMLKYFVVFAILAVCLFALMYTLGSEMVERIGCCEEAIPETDAPETDAPETDAPETDASETDALESKRIKP